MAMASMKATDFSSTADMSLNASPHYLRLSKNPIHFESFSSTTNVFFDDSNRQVFCVRSTGTTTVSVKGPEEDSSINFRMEDRGDVISMKFSPDNKVLAIQRSQKSVEFINFLDGVDVLEYSQTCKGKSTKIVGFCWTSVNEIVFVTDHGIELYQIIPEKRLLRSQKTFSISVNWFVWLPENSVLLLSSGPLGNIIHPFSFKGQVFKLPKFEVDLPVIPKPPRLCLLERDVTMANIYCQIYIVVLRHQPRSAGNSGAEIVLYQLQKESPARKTDVLRLDLSGRFAVNIVDNLIVVHHQASKTSIVFDINLDGESDGFVTYHQPVVSPQSIQPFTLKRQAANLGLTPVESKVQCELYSPNWIVFQPNILIDAKLGCLWYVEMQLGPVIEMLPDKVRLLSFLMCRRESKAQILAVCHQLLNQGPTSLPAISGFFDLINSVLQKDIADKEAQAEAAASKTPDDKTKTSGDKGGKMYKAIIDQSDMYTHVLRVFVENKNLHYKFIVAVLVEYIRSLNQFKIPVQHYLFELVSNTLVNHGCFYQLHQFLQYHVLSDSKPIACLLLSLESVYPPAHQLALDMLKRLSTATEEIIEVFLSKQQLLQALRFIRSVGYVDKVQSRKFLAAAMQTQDPMIFYTVYKFFEQRNIRLTNSAKFPEGKHCEVYVKHFEALFGSDALDQGSGL